jgi:hypothetical protein
MPPSDLAALQARAVTFGHLCWSGAMQTMPSSCRLGVADDLVDEFERDALLDVYGCRFVDRDRVAGERVDRARESDRPRLEPAACSEDRR